VTGPVTWLFISSTPASFLFALAILSFSGIRGPHSFFTNHDAYSPLTYGMNEGLYRIVLAAINPEACYPWRTLPTASIEAIAVGSLLGLSDCFYCHLGGRRCICKIPGDPWRPVCKGVPLPQWQIFRQWTPHMPRYAFMLDSIVRAWLYAPHLNLGRGRSTVGTLQGDCS
jgi:hypothetical protein